MTRLAAFSPRSQMQQRGKGRFRLFRLIIFGGCLLVCVVSFSVFIHLHSSAFTSSIHGLENTLASFTGKDLTVITIQSPGNFIKLQQPGRAIVTVEDPEKPVGDPSRIIQQIEIPGGAAPASRPHEIATNPANNLERVLDDTVPIKKEHGTAPIKKDPPTTEAHAVAINGLPITAQNHAHEFRENLDAKFSTSETSFCVPWDVNSDEWWTNHPVWEMGAENDTHYCFQKIQDVGKKRIYKQIYNTNFHGDCSKTHTKRMWNSGWSADLTNVIDGIKHVVVDKHPVQVVEKAWHYAHPASAKPTPGNKGVPPACPRGNMFCYFLPLSSCPAAPVGEKGQFLEDTHAHTRDNQMYYEYVTRRQTWLRKAVYEYRKKQNVHGPCTAIHVRRGDVVLHTSGLKRRYHAIAEYMNATDSIHNNIYLMTDDANAINEAKLEFPDYNWMYLDRPRYKASEGGWEKQIPSNNPTLEVVMLLSEFQLARECDQLIHSRSGFATQLYAEMKSAGQKVDRIDLDQGKGKEIFSANNHETEQISAKYADVDVQKKS